MSIQCLFEIAENLLGFVDIGQITRDTDCDIVVFEIVLKRHSIDYRCYSKKT